MRPASDAAGRTQRAAVRRLHGAADSACQKLYDSLLVVAFAMAVSNFSRRETQSRAAESSRPRSVDPAREAFLNGIANRLGRPRIHDEPPRSREDSAVVLPSNDRAKLSAQFERELLRLGALCEFTDSLSDLHRALRQKLEQWSPRRMISWSRDELVSFQLDWLWDELGCVTPTRARPEPPLDRAPFDDVCAASFRTLAMQADVGITGVDFALANTGTLALSAAPGRPRSVSLVPAVHIALVREAQIVSHLGDALGAYFGKGAPAPSGVHFISGPSRTSDIENDHTIGVHGPAVVIVIVWRSSAGERVADRRAGVGGNPS